MKRTAKRGRCLPLRMSPSQHSQSSEWVPCDPESLMPSPTSPKVAESRTAISCCFLVSLCVPHKHHEVKFSLPLGSNTFEKRQDHGQSVAPLSVPLVPVAGASTYVPADSHRGEWAGYFARTDHCTTKIFAAGFDVSTYDTYRWPCLRRVSAGEIRRNSHRRDSQAIIGTSVASDVRGMASRSLCRLMVVLAGALVTSSPVLWRPWL